MSPTEIPQFSPSTDEEKGLWNRAQAARDAMG
jgi:hypothetical protein